MVAETTPTGADPSQNTAVKQPWEDLGFDSFEAYQQAQDAQVEKLRKQTEDRQAMIDRQGKEIGELRKTPKPAETTPPPNTPPPEDDVTREAVRTLTDLKITMSADQKQKVQEALDAAEPDIIEIVKKDPRSRLVFMKNALGDEFQLPRPKVDIFDGIGPSPVSKPLHEQLAELLATKTETAPTKPMPTHGAPRTRTTTDSDEEVPTGPRFRAALRGGVTGLQAQLKQNESE